MSVEPILCFAYIFGELGVFLSKTVSQVQFTKTIVFWRLSWLQGNFHDIKQESMYNSFTLWVGLSRSTLQSACKAGKDPQMPNFHSFLLLSLINRFGKENSQLAKYIRVTRNWSYQKLFCMILSNICFCAFLYEKVLFVMKRVLDVMKVSKILLFW